LSKGWAGGSTRRYRKLRAFVLRQAGHTCQMQTHPEVQELARARGVNLAAKCTGTATHMHHLDGVAAGKVCPPSRAVASCPECNYAIGEVTAERKAGRGRPADPAPNPPRTNW
jgi:hypothetical protein